MNVQLTCACGRRQDVSIAFAGKNLECVECGQSLSVPALGVVAPAARKGAVVAKPVADASSFALASPNRPARRSAWAISSRWASALLLVMCGAMLMFAAVVVALILGLREPPISPVPNAQSPPPAAPREDPPAPGTPSPSETFTKPLPIEPSPPVNLRPVEPAAPPAVPTITKPPEPMPPAPAVIAKPAVIEKPAVPALAVKRPFKEGDTVLQDLLVTQKSRFVVQGLPVATMLQYRVGSRYTVRKVHNDGLLTVEQKIEASALTQADDITRGLLAESVERMPGTTFTLELSPRGEATSFAGKGGKVQAAMLPGGLGVQMASLLDADGWKELAQATFYQPEQHDKAGRWTRPMTHTWGPLGGWVGQVSYAYPGPEKGPQVKVPYALKIAYQPPKGPGAAGALPLQIVGSNFQPAQAGGTLLFDTERRRVVAAEERFLVRGTMMLNLLGQNSPTEIEEEQVFQMRIGEK